MSEKTAEDNSSSSKISGYLEKKGKKKMMASYKKYWFVLEGRLLLYYRSEDEYKGISPCKGSINLGPPCSVKPCLSSPGVFQIETRSSTITLRAENMEEQNKWMHCLMTAINPAKQPPKLSHFRYAAEGKQQKTTNPQNSNFTSKPNKVLMERLQKIGAQTYVTQLLNRKMDVGKKAMSEESLFRGNCDCIVQISRSSENVALSQRSAEHIYERISKESLGSTESTAGNTVVRHESASSKNKLFNEDLGDNADKKSKSHKLSGESFRSSGLSVNVEMDNQSTLTTTRNDSHTRESEYSKHTQKGISRKPSTKIQNRPTSLNIVTNDYANKQTLMTIESNKAEVATQTEMHEHGNMYSVVGKKVDRENNIVMAETGEKVDQNENKVGTPDSTSRNIEENAYCIGDIYELVKNNDVLYEDLEKYAKYCELKNKEVEKNKTKDKKLRKKDEDVEDRKEKLKKRPSFIKRVWKRKSKKNNDEQSLDSPVSPMSPVSDLGDKICLSDGTTIRMLSELHEILEHKVPILLGKLSQSSSSESNRRSDSSIEEKASSNSGATAMDICGNDKDCPALPPKTKKIDCSSPYHDLPTNNQPTALPAKRKKKLEDVKSLDEILDELECQKREEPVKVRNLIHQFSLNENTSEPSEVVLRRHRRIKYPREDIESDELTRLLEELAKVTNAPILTPGATCSMVASNSGDKELSKLLPERRRRYSEPDYDIPRSHKSLKSFRKKEETDNVIGSTRFFGPILKPSDIETNRLDRSENGPESMTPDSLEENLQESSCKHATSNCKHDDGYSYNHHFNHRKTKNTNLRTDDKELIIYDDLYVNFKPYGSVYSNEHYFRNGRMPCRKHEDMKSEDDVFIDSLEVCNAETSTAF